MKEKYIEQYISLNIPLEHYRKRVKVFRDNVFSYSYWVEGIHFDCDIEETKRRINANKNPNFELQVEII